MINIFLILSFHNIRNYLNLSELRIHVGVCQTSNPFSQWEAKLRENYANIQRFRISSIVVLKEDADGAQNGLILFPSSFPSTLQKIQRPKAYLPTKEFACPCITLAFPKLKYSRNIYSHYH